MRFIARILGNMAGIWLAVLIVPSISFALGENAGQTWLYLALIALILTIVNSLVRPIMRVVAFPLYIITFGLFSLVTNAAVFSLAAWLSGTFQLPLVVDSFWGAVAGGTITAIISSIIVGVLGPLTKPDPR